MSAPGHMSFGNNAACVSSYMMDEAPGYFAHMCNRLKTHLHGNVLEVGCGTGICTPHLAVLSGVTSVTAIDLEEAALEEAKRRVSSPTVLFRHANLSEMPDAAYDSILCANVVEHIEDDAAALRSLYRVVRPGGTLALLVPAHPVLYSRYDHEAGHYRRYTRRTLRPLVTQAGFTIDRLFYFNALGALGWYISFKVFQRRGVSEGKTRFLIRSYHRFGLPVSRFLESLFPPPFGLSVVALCTRPT